MILIDVDREYEKPDEEFLPRAEEILRPMKIQWPNTVAQDGFNDTIRWFNMHGYGQVVVDANGIVRGLGFIHGEKMERLLTEVVTGESHEPSTDESRKE